MKDKFIKSTIILAIGGILTKLMGMFIRIMMIRLSGSDAITLFALVSPTFGLFITLSQFSLPTTLVKIIGEEKYNNRKIMLSVIPLSIIYNILLMLIILIAAPLITTYLLKDSRCLIPILAIIFVLPIDTTSNVIRSYFFGKQNMFPHVFSILIEQTTRLILIIIITPLLLKKGITIVVAWFIFVNMISEAMAIISISFFLPKKNKIITTDFKPNKDLLREIFDISIPTTIGKLIASISGFIEPIILINLLSKNYNINFIKTQYGIINGYSLPILMIPSFLIGIIASSLLPSLSKYYRNNDKYNFKNKIKLSIFITILIVVPITFFLILNPSFLLRLFYKTSVGSNYIKILAPIFFLSCFQIIISTILQASDKSKKLMLNNIISIILKNVILIILCNFKFGIYALFISIGICNIIVILLNYNEIKKII